MNNKSKEIKIKQRLIKLYKQMYNLTNPECHKCRAPLSCCSAEYCEQAIFLAKDIWQEDLTGLIIKDNKVPFLDSIKGCVIKPHLRPTCTIHVCCINNLGFFPNNPKLTTKYFNLRNNIEILENNLLCIQEKILN